MQLLFEKIYLRTPRLLVERAESELAFDFRFRNSIHMKNSAQSRPLPYNIERWSDGYVNVSDSGELQICPHRANGPAISLNALVGKIKASGLRTPTLVRFKSILHDRVNTLVNTFNSTARELAYRGRYQVVYPIKVNQQRRVVEEIVQAQPARKNGQVGLEAGSKPELLAVLAMNLEPGSVIVCNGYKDQEYIRMALMGQSLGYRVYIVVEKLSELQLIIEQAKQLGIAPLLGIRARLSTIGKGNWQNTGGEKSKFGLSAAQIISALDYLAREGYSEALRLLHFHLGSQIANIRDIHKGLQECARIYSQLHAMGAPIDTVDIGGGLGVDYDGTGSRNVCSINYELSDYALNVLQSFKDECDLHDLPHPDVISESGRALTAHHAILITDVVASEIPDTHSAENPGESAAGPLQHLWRDYQALQDGRTKRSLIEIYHDAAHAIEDAQTMFTQGTLTLAEKATAERLFTANCRLLVDLLQPEHRDHREIIDQLNEKLAEKLFVNFSLFQSLPDIWGIDQIFPVLPIENLDKALTRRGIIQDITCDSDGRIDQYVSSNGIENSLQLPDKSNDKHELLCFFMIGAYQEILGDMHNLFGDTDSVDVSMDDDGEIKLEHALRGDTIARVLQYVNLAPDYLMENYRALLAKRPLSEAQQEQHLIAFEKGLESYTYLSSPVAR